MISNKLVANPEGIGWENRDPLSTLAFKYVNKKCEINTGTYIQLMKLHAVNYLPINTCITAKSKIIEQ